MVGEGGIAPPTTALSEQKVAELILLIFKQVRLFTLSYYLDDHPIKDTLLPLSVLLRNWL